MKAYQDLTDARTCERQRQMMLALRKAGLGNHIERELPDILLSPTFCQWRARDKRRELHDASTLLFSRRTRAQTLSFVTWVPPEARHAFSPTPMSPVAILDRFASAAQALGAQAIAASTEVDYDATLGVWQQTVHAILLRPQTAEKATISAQLKAALVPSRGCNAPYRPMMVKAVTDLDGLISYVFKNVSLPSTTQRVTIEGHARPWKQSLRTAQLKQLLRQTLDGEVSSQLVTTLSNEVRK